MKFFSQNKEMNAVVIIFSGGLTMMGLGLVVLACSGHLSGIIFLLIGFWIFIESVSILFRFQKIDAEGKIIQNLNLKNKK